MKGHQFWRATRHAFDTLYAREPGGPIERFIKDDNAVGQVAPGGVRLPTEGILPSFEGATSWLNSPPLTPADLQGKVVLVDFWTYTCINWLRTLPYVRAWAEKYKDDGLVAIGVHSPEFSFEHDVDNVRRAAEEMRVAYPIVVDSDFAIWSAFNNHFWPALYVADAQGQLRYHHSGEGDYDEADMVIQYLLTAAGINVPDPASATVDAQGIEAPADWGNLQSPETYLGYARGENFASPGGATWDRQRIYAAPARLRLNEWALSGNWTVGQEAAILNAANGRITSRFHARDLHLVLAPPTTGTTVRFRVLLDGQAPGTAHGIDVDDQGNGTMTEPRLYQLIRQPMRIVDRQFDIVFLDPGVEAYVFTFG